MSLATTGSAYHRDTVIDGRYRLVRCLDEGGMSWVWLARHQGLDVPVAMKIAKPDTCGPPHWEARIAARLRHPAIVAVFDSGLTAHGDAFVVMEYLIGEPLSAVLERDGQLTVPAAVRLLLSILDALDYCHEQGVVHRDVKPANIFLAREHVETHAKLLDFGVAKPLCSATLSPELAGTPGYMAPEQVTGLAPTDPRADLWALCAVLYECVAGQPAIDGDTCAKRLLASSRPVIAPLSRTPDEASLWPILERGLREDPAERFHSAGELRERLEHWLSAAGVSCDRDSRGEELRSQYVRPRRYIQCDWGARPEPRLESEPRRAPPRRRSHRSLVAVYRDRGYAA